MLMLILILITCKLILIEFPINWLTIKVTDFVINVRRSRCTIVVHYSLHWLRSNQIRTFSDPCCVVLCIIGACMCAGRVQ